MSIDFVCEQDDSAKDTDMFRVMDQLNQYGQKNLGCTSDIRGSIDPVREVIIINVMYQSQKIPTPEYWRELDQTLSGLNMRRVTSQPHQYAP